MTTPRRATQRSHFTRFQAELAFASRRSPSGGQTSGQAGPEALEALRRHLRETLLGPSRISALAPVRW